MKLISKKKIPVLTPTLTCIGNILKLFGFLSRCDIVENVNGDLTMFIRNNIGLVSSKSLLIYNDGHQIIGVSKGHVTEINPELDLEDYINRENLSTSIKQIMIESNKLNNEYMEQHILNVSKELDTLGLSEEVKNSILSRVRKGDEVKINCCKDK